jgi:hypothetical protein
MKIFVEQGRSEQMRRKGAIFPWALSDAFAGDERRTAHTDAVAARWLVAAGSLHTEKGYSQQYLRPDNQGP